MEFGASKPCHGPQRPTPSPPIPVSSPPPREQASTGPKAARDSAPALPVKPVCLWHPGSGALLDPRQSPTAPPSIPIACQPADPENPDLGVLLGFKALQQAAQHVDGVEVRRLAGGGCAVDISGLMAQAMGVRALRGA